MRAVTRYARQLVPSCDAVGATHELQGAAAPQRRCRTRTANDARPSWLSYMGYAYFSSMPSFNPAPDRVAPRVQRINAIPADPRLSTANGTMPVPHVFAIAVALDSDVNAHIWKTFSR